MFKGIISAIGNIAGAIKGFFDWRERQDHIQAGRNVERLGQSETARAASREMREIENEVEGLPDDARRELARGWVLGAKNGDRDDG